MAPPELARDAPGLNVLEPFEIGLLPVLRDEEGLALAHRRERGLSQRLGVDVPLVGEPGLDDGVGAVAVRNGVRVRLDLLQPALGGHQADDALARLETIDAVNARR